MSIGPHPDHTFGQLRRVTEVTARGTTPDGHAFACFTQEWGEHSTMTHSATEGRRWSNF